MHSFKKNGGNDMPQPFSEEQKQQWKERILKQRESGFSIASWCRKNNIVIHNFYYWQDKLFPKTILDRSAFTEIPDQNRTVVPDLKKTGIIIEYQQIRIHLDRHFEPKTLKQCLEVLKEILC